MRVDKKIYDKFVKLYKEKKINRDQICRELNVSYNSVYGALLRRGIKIWDNYKKSNRKIDYSEFRNIYQKGGMTRKEICDKYKLNISSFSQSLRYFGVEIWDVKQKRKKGNPDYPGKYHNPRLDKSTYALMFYDYNR